MLPRQPKAYSTSRKKLLFNFVQEQAELCRKDSIQSATKSSSEVTRPKVYQLREPPNIKYFQDENDTEDFSPDCSDEYIPSPERTLPNSRSTSSSCTDFQDSVKVISSGTITFQENDNRSTSSLGGDSLVIDNLLHMENITQSPSTVSNLSLMLSETDFVASPKVIYKKSFFCSPKKQDSTSNKLLDVTLTPSSERKQLALCNRDVTDQQSTSYDLEKTLTPMRSTSSDSNLTILDSEFIQKEQETTKSVNDETKLIVLQKYEIEITIEPESPINDSITDDECIELNAYSHNLSNIQDIIKGKEHEEQNIREEIFLDDSEENRTKEDNDDNNNVNVDPLELIDQLSSSSVNEEPDRLCQLETLTPVIPVELSTVNDINEFVTNIEAIQVSDAENPNPLELDPKKLTRKRKADPSEWRDNKNKKLKNSGQAYEGARNKKCHPSKNILPDCACKKSCWLKFNSELRLALYNNFYITPARQWHIMCHANST